MPTYQDVDPDIKAMQGIQPWYANLMCLALRIKSRLRRSGPAPMKPRLAA